MIYFQFIFTQELKAVKTRENQDGFHVLTTFVPALFQFYDSGGAVKKEI